MVHALLAYAFRFNNCAETICPKKNYDLQVQNQRTAHIEHDIGAQLPGDDALREQFDVEA